MYADYFSLTEKPFSITPDPDYLFLSKRHEEALAHLLYGVKDSGGFIQLTGEVGTGKTTIIRSLFGRIPKNVEIALILNPKLSESEFLHSICDELLIPVTKENTNKECFDALNSYLLDAHSQGKKVVLLVDEAQNLAVNVLEYIRLLTNLETDKDKLLQIILVGQPELQTLLQRQDLRQLTQRITARYHLVPLNKAEANAYIEHRLKVAGSDREVFTKAAKTEIFNAAKGIPRLINVLADRALLGAYSKEKSKVDKKLAKQVISEVFGQQVKVNRPNSWIKKIILFTALSLGIVLFTYWAIMSDVTQKVVEVFEKNKPVLEQAQIKSVPDSIAPIQDELKESIQVVSLTEKNDSLSEGPITISLATLLSENVSETTAQKSIQKLLTLWDKKEIVPFDDVCRNVMNINLRCLYRNSNWQNIVNVNRPLIIELEDEKNIIHNLLIRHANSKYALVLINQQEVLVLLDEILTTWKGDYLLFWEPQENFLDGSLQVGSNGSDVRWLKKQLEVLNISPKTNKENANFGGATMLQVKSFQKQNNLLADGVVGRETFIAINNALDLPGRPKLVKDSLLKGAK